MHSYFFIQYNIVYTRFGRVARSQIRISAGSPCRFFWSLHARAALWRDVYCFSPTKSPLGTIREGKAISMRSVVSISSRYDLSY